LISAPKLSTPLLVTSFYGHSDVVKCLLSSGADINLCDKQGNSPLLEASCEGHCDIVKCLLSSGADINYGDIPCSLHKLISAPELSKHLTTSQCPCSDAVKIGDCPSFARKLMITIV
jgi:ankyrin repeat protein